MANLDVFKESTLQAIQAETRLVNAQLKIIANGYDIESMQALQELADSGLASRFINVGDQIQSTWTDVEANRTYDCPWDVLGFGTINTPNGETKNAIYLGMHYCTPFDIDFDKPEKLEATEATAEEGIYYYGFDGNSAYTYLNTLESGDAIPYSSYSAVYKNEIKDTASNIIRYGYNRWSHSAYRQWLNSSAAKNAWWEAQHIGDVAPTQLTTKAGFMTGFPSDFLTFINPIEVKTALNTVTDGGTSTSGEDTTYDTFFLPSIEQMYGVPQLASVEGPYFDYWKDATGLSAPSNAANEGRKIYDMSAITTSRICRVRSAARSHSYHVWLCSTAGQLTSGSASYAYRCAPACAIYKP